MSRRGAFRPTLVTLLLLGALFSAAPWIGCAFVVPLWIIDPVLLLGCTFGHPAAQAGWGLPGFAGPYWGNLIAGIVYLIAAAYTASTKRSL